MSIKFQLPELKEGSSCSSGSSGRRTPSRQLTTNTAILRASSDEERLKQGLAVSQFALPGASASWIIRLLNAPLDDLVVYPRRYLAASHEVFLYTLIVTWVITLIFHPEQIFDHPAQPIIGSFNPCFGWDYPPASYISVVLCGVNVYLTWRYTYTTTACCLSPARPTAPPHHVLQGTRPARPALSLARLAPRLRPTTSDAAGGSSAHG